MKILVLGSEGQIGKPLCKFLREQGHEVLGLDLVHGVRQDLRHIDSLMKATYFRWADFVYFLAWDVGGSKYLSKYEKTIDFLNNNIDIMKNVFNTLEEYKLPFIFTSTQMSNILHSSYGTLKHLGEFYTNILGGLNIKFNNIFGYEGNDPLKHHVITDFINMAKKDGTIKSLTTGLEERQFLHTDDSSRALYTLLQKYNELDKTRDYCITNFEWNTIREVAQLVADEFPGCKLEFAQKSDTVQGGYKNEPDDYILQYWQPKHTLKEGIQKVIKDMENE